MAERDPSSTCQLFLEPTRVAERLSTVTADRNVLAFAPERAPSTWRRWWRGNVGWRPAQTAIVTGYERTRGAATGTRTQVVEPDLAVTTVQRPFGGDDVSAALGEHLTGWSDSRNSTLVYLESLTTVVADAGLEAALAATADVLARAADIDAAVYAGLDGDAAEPGTVVAFRELFDSVHGEAVVDPDARVAVERLREADPTTFGYARRHWAEARRAIEGTSRSYAQSRQLHADLVEPETTPRTLGATMQALVTLGVVDVWGETVGANRYDLRSYDPDRLAAVGLALDAAE